MQSNPQQKVDLAQGMKIKQTYWFDEMVEENGDHAFAEEIRELKNRLPKDGQALSEMSIDELKDLSSEFDDMNNRYIDFCKEH